MKNKVNAGNACYFLLPNHVFSSILSKNMKLKYTNYNCACFIRVRNLVSHSKGRRPARDVREQIAEERIWVTVGGSDGTGEDCIMRSFLLCIHRQILFGWWNQGEWDWWGISQEWGTGEIISGFRGES